MGWLETTYFRKIRCFKRLSGAVESTKYQGFCPFLGGKWGRRERGAPQNWKTLLSSGKLCWENVELKEMTNCPLCKAGMGMALVGAEGREGRSCWRFIIFCMDLLMESLCTLGWQEQHWPASSGLGRVAPRVGWVERIDHKKVNSIPGFFFPLFHVFFCIYACLKEWWVPLRN